MARSRQGNSEVSSSAGMGWLDVLLTGRRMAVCGGDVIVKPPTTGMEGMWRSTYCPGRCRSGGW